jgi:hypothetical protein
MVGKSALRTRLDKYYRVTAMCELYRIGASIRQRPDRQAAWEGAIIELLNACT